MQLLTDHGLIRAAVDTTDAHSVAGAQDRILLLVLAAGGDGIHVEATLLVDTEREVFTPLLGLLPLLADHGQLLHHLTLQLG